MPAGRATRAESRFRAEAQELANLLRETRERLDLTQEQLASRAQVAVSTLRKIETGRVVEPGYFTVLYLALELQIKLEDLARVSRRKP